MGKLLRDFIAIGMNPKSSKSQFGDLSNAKSNLATDGVAGIASSSISAPGTWRVLPEFTYKRKPEQTLMQKAIQLQNNVDVICDIINLADKIEKDI